MAEIGKSEPEQGKVSVKKRKRKAKDSGILFCVLFLVFFKALNFAIGYKANIRICYICVTQRNGRRIQCL